LKTQVYAGSPFCTGKENPIAVFEPPLPVALLLPQSPDAAFVERTTGDVGKAEKDRTGAKTGEKKQQKILYHTLHPP
jgi:hypothetical protein